jgi:hypothetical protein
MRSLKVAAILSLCWVQSACGPDGPGGPEATAILNSAEVAVQPVLDTLRFYRSQHGRYPASLNELVGNGLLSRLPAHGAESLEYAVSGDRAVFLLAIGQQAYSVGGPGDTLYRCFYSDVGRWLSLGGYPGLAKHLEDPTYPQDWGK